MCILDNDIADRSGVLGDTHVVVTRPARWSLICCRPDEHMGGRNATDCQDARYRVPGREAQMASLAKKKPACLCRFSRYLD